MKNRTLSLVLIIAFAAGLGGYVVLTRFVFPPDAMRPLAQETNSDASAAHMAFEEEARSGMDGLMDVYYPRASDGVSEEMLETFNLRLEKDVLNIENEFIPEAEDALEAAEEDALMVGLNVSYRVPTSTSRLQSVVLDGYQSLGGAHGLPFNRTYIFDTQTGKFLNLEDLFEPNANPLTQLSTFARQELMTREFVRDDPEWVEGGIAPIAENYQNTYISDEGLTVIFGAYQVAPYVAGPQEVTVPWSELEELETGFFPSSEKS